MKEQEKMKIFKRFTDFNDRELKDIMPYFEFKKFKKKGLVETMPSFKIQYPMKNHYKHNGFS